LFLRSSSSARSRSTRRAFSIARAARSASSCRELLIALGEGSSVGVAPEPERADHLTEGAQRADQGRVHAEVAERLAGIWAEHGARPVELVAAEHQRAGPAHGGAEGGEIGDIGRR